MTLLPQHRDDLARSGLTDATIAACQFRSVTDAEEAGRILGWERPPRDMGPFLAIPFFHPDGAPNFFTRLKPDHPRRHNGKRVKYESPRGTPNRAYFPPRTIAALPDPTAPLVLTEGEKKAAAADQHGIPCVGLVGVYGFHKKRAAGPDGVKAGPRALIDDLAAVAWGGRTVYVCYDSDLAEKWEVRRAEWHLAETLRAAGAVVKAVRLPSGPNGAKHGLDDYLLSNGTDAFRKLLKAAKAPRKPKRPRTAAAGAVPSGAPEARLHLTDLGNAERLRQRHGADLRYCHPWGEWLAWDGRRWRRDDAGEVGRRAAATALGIYGEAERCPDRGRRVELAEHAVASESAASLRAMIDLARSALPVLPEQLDADPWALNVVNGTLDLRTATLRPHRREDLITKLAPVAFDPDADCPLWRKCVERWMGGDAGLADYLRRIAGYWLTGDVSEQAMWLCHGAGANGKSTFLGVLLHLLGDYAGQAVPELVMERRHEAHPSERADLFGKRFVAAVEVDEGKRMAESLMKSLTGGDRIKARELYCKPFEFNPTHKLCLAANHKPTIRGTDFAVWRRIKLVPFTVTIPDAEKDKDLLAKLKAEAAGVLAWAVTGCLDWQRDGLQEPDVVRAATKQYREEQDLLGDFIAERCFVNASVKSKASELLEAYIRFSGDKAMTHVAFARRLEARGHAEEKDRSGKFYHGLRLREVSENKACDGL
jgi:putative DNA primase/helicase